MQIAVKRQELDNYRGVAYDLSRSFNKIKEKKRSRFRKHVDDVENIINHSTETDLFQNAYLIEEKIDELGKICTHVIFS
jgi:hypothetical protein